MYIVRSTLDRLERQSGAEPALQNDERADPGMTETAEYESVPQYTVVHQINQINLGLGDMQMVRRGVHGRDAAPEGDHERKEYAEVLPVTAHARRAIVKPLIQDVITW